MPFHTIQSSTNHGLQNHYNLIGILIFTCTVNQFWTKCLQLVRQKSNFQVKRLDVFVIFLYLPCQNHWKIRAYRPNIISSAFATSFFVESVASCVQISIINSRNFNFISNISLNVKYIVGCHRLHLKSISQICTTSSILV